MLRQPIRASTLAENAGRHQMNHPSTETHETSWVHFGKAQPQLGELNFLIGIDLGPSANEQYNAMDKDDVSGVISIEY